MESQLYFAFVVAATIMIALPGPSVLLTVAHSISFGWKRALATVAGETLGNCRTTCHRCSWSKLIAKCRCRSVLIGSAGPVPHILFYLGIKQWRSAK